MAESSRDAGIPVAPSAVAGAVNAAAPTGESAPAGESVPADAVAADQGGAADTPADVPAAWPVQLRGEVGSMESLFWGATCLAAVTAVWFFVTAGESEARFISSTTLPSPLETVMELPRVIGERRLVANTLVTLERVCLGFGLAAAVGIPLGVLAACFPAVRAFLAPLAVFGRNVPVAALIPLTFILFGIGEFQKIMFLFIASVAFILSDTTSAVLEVPQRYVDTALTLGASRIQIILKVLAPLAAPAIFNSLRLLFGIAFGYVMLAELVKLGGDTGGLGDLIMASQRRNQREPILIVLIVIPLVAYGIDRLLWWLQCDLFPYRYGGRGLLPRACHACWQWLLDTTSDGEAET